MKRRDQKPTRAELARELARAQRENERLLDVLAESARERTDLRAQLSREVL